MSRASKINALLFSVLKETCRVWLMCYKIVFGDDSGGGVDGKIAAEV